MFSRAGTAAPPACARRRGNERWTILPQQSSGKSTSCAMRCTGCQVVFTHQIAARESVHLLHCTTSPLRNFALICTEVDYTTNPVDVSPLNTLLRTRFLLHHDTPSSGDTSPLSSWLW